MSICFENEGEMVVIIPMERDPYTQEEADSFYRIYDALLAYANRRLRIVPRGPITMNTGDPAILARAGRVSERLWLNPGIIDDFVAQNPAELTGAELEDAAGWRHAVRDLFLVVNAQDDHVLYLNKDLTFCAAGLAKPADRCIHAVPDLLFTTLLPYRGGIVTDGKVMHVTCDFTHDQIAQIAQIARESAHRGIAATAGELISYEEANPCPNRLSNEWQAQIDRAFGLKPITC